MLACRYATVLVYAGMCGCVCLRVVSVCICFLSDAGRYKKSKVVLENTFYIFLGFTGIISPHLSGTHDSSFDQKKWLN